jgi:hypothetical protein
VLDALPPLAVPLVPSLADPSPALVAWPVVPPLARPAVVEELVLVPLLPSLDPESPAAGSLLLAPHATTPVHSNATTDLRIQRWFMADLCEQALRKSVVFSSQQAPARAEMASVSTSQADQSAGAETAR